MKTASNASNIASTRELTQRSSAPLATPTDLSSAATKDISSALNAVLADVFALYLKSKNFHWHMSGPHFRDYHLMLDEQAPQLFAMTDPMAEAAASSAGRPCDPSATSAAPSACWTTTPNSSNPWT